AGGTGLGSQYPSVGDPAPAASGDGRRDASLRVGPARTTTSGAASRLSDRGDLARHATRAPRAVGASRALRRAADGGWTGAHAAPHGAHGPSHPARRGGGGGGAGSAAGGGIGHRGRAAARLRGAGACPRVATGPRRPAGAG